MSSLTAQANKGNTYAHSLSPVFLSAAHIYVSQGVDGQQEAVSGVPDPQEVSADQQVPGGL